MLAAPGTVQSYARKDVHRAAVRAAAAAGLASTIESQKEETPDEMGGT